MTQMSGKEFWFRVQLSPAEQGRRKEEEGDSWSIIFSYTILLISCSCLVYQLLSFQPPGRASWFACWPSGKIQVPVVFPDSKTVMLKSSFGFLKSYCPRQTTAHPTPPTTQHPTWQYCGLYFRPGELPSRCVCCVEYGNLPTLTSCLAHNIPSSGCRLIEKDYR